MQAWLAAAVMLGVSCASCSGERTSPSRHAQSATATGGAAVQPRTETVARSKGCGKSPGPSGERRSVVDGRTGLFIVSLPGAYDAARSYPLGFAFHGRNRNHVNCQQTDCAGVQAVMSEHAILVYMQSLREPLDQPQGGWEWPTELEPNVQFFQAVLATVQSEYCVDRQRIFLAGSSSGGAFAHGLGCRYPDRLLAVSAVSGGWLESESCERAPAALLLHGIDDPHVPIARGELALRSYRERLQCRPTSEPPLSTMHARVRTARDRAPSVETAACVDYEGCSPGAALRWCEHSYGGYDGSTHGWPPVGGQLIWDFVSKL